MSGIFSTNEIIKTGDLKKEQDLLKVNVFILSSIKDSVIKDGTSLASAFHGLSREAVETIERFTPLEILTLADNFSDSGLIFNCINLDFCLRMKKVDKHSLVAETAFLLKR